MAKSKNQKTFKIKNILSELEEKRDFYQFRYNSYPVNSKDWKKFYRLYLEYDLIVEVAKGLNSGELKF